MSRTPRNKKTILAEMRAIKEFSDALHKKGTHVASPHKAISTALCLGAVYALGWILGEEIPASERIVTHAARRPVRFENFKPKTNTFVEKKGLR